jgi:manganese transport protein
MASLMAVGVQYLSSKVGLSTGRSLPELCRDRFGRGVNVVLWLQAEAVAMATDLAEFVGAALGLNLVFGVPLLPAGLITALVAFALLGLQRRGYRRFELAIVALLALVALGFGYLLVRTGGPHWPGLAAGLVPRLSGSGTVSLAVGIVGATVMPHVVYLHSALHKDRTAGLAVTGSAAVIERRRLLTASRWDCGLGLGAAGLVNLAMLCVAATLAGLGPPTTGDLGGAGAGVLGVIHSRLATLVGGGAALAFGVALMASGLASSSVGTYAGQEVMSGFMDWRIPALTRRAVTMLPSLIVLALAINPTEVLVYSQIVLSFGIPFALVPLLLITRDRDVLGAAVNTRLTTAFIGLTTLVITGLNLYLLTRLVAGLRA